MQQQRNSNMHKIKIKQPSSHNYALKAKEDKTNVNKGKTSKQSMKNNQMNTSHHLNHIGNKNYSKGTNKRVKMSSANLPHLHLF